MRTPIFTQTADGYFVSELPKQILMAPEFIAHSLFPMIRVEGRVIISVENGHAVYNIEGRSGRSLRLRRLSGGLAYPAPDPEDPEDPEDPGDPEGGKE